MAATSGKSTEHLAWEKRLGKIAEVARAWQKRMAEEPVPIEPGSALAGDDSTFADLSVSSLASYSMAVAVEHLDFCLLALDKTSTIYPTAYLTVLRSTLLSASHAVWLLAPAKRAERQRNALELLADDLRTQAGAIAAVHAPTQKMQAAQDKAVKGLQERQALLQTIADTLKPGLKVEKCRIHDTDIIAAVARVVHDEEFLVSATNLIWRTGSAAAHGGRSFAVSRIRHDQVIQGESGTSFSTLKGDLEHDIGPAAAGATLVLSKAFELYDQRRLNQRIRRA